MQDKRFFITVNWRDPFSVELDMEMQDFYMFLLWYLHICCVWHSIASSPWRSRNKLNLKADMDDMRVV